MTADSGNSGKRRFRWYLTAAVLLLLVVLLAAIIFSMTPFAFRTIWFPMAGKSLGSDIRCSQIEFLSFFPFRFKTAGFEYSDPETSITIRSATSGQKLRQLWNHRIELLETVIDDIRIVHRIGQHTQPDPLSPAFSAAPEEDLQPWLFSMRKFEIRNAFFEQKEPDGRKIHTWTIRSLKGDRFQTDVPCRLSADAVVRSFPNKRSPLHIRSLPFRMNSEYLLDRDFRLKRFKMALKTGIFDLSALPDIVIPEKAGIRASVNIEGFFLNPETLRISHSEIQLFKEQRNIGNLQFEGTLGNTFQCKVLFSGLDLNPCLSLLAPKSHVQLEVSKAELVTTGRDFSPESIRSDLKSRLIAEMKNFSVPIELNRKNRLLRLIAIPIEAMPTFMETLKLKWNLKKELNQCVNAIDAVISGRQNLNFDHAVMDISQEGTLVKITRITLYGHDIRIESIRGTLDMVTEEIDLQTVLVIGDLSIPLKFKGTLTHPSFSIKHALKDFIVLNTPFLERLNSLLTEPPSKDDSQLERAIKRGRRNLQKYLKSPEEKNQKTTPPAPDKGAGDKKQPLNPPAPANIEKTT